MRSLYIIPCFVFSFLACTARPLPSLIPYCDGPKWGYADTNGKIVIAPQWDGANFFSGNRAIVFISKGNGSRTQCLIDRTGTYIIPPERQWTGTYIGWQGDLNFTDGNGHWGMIDTNNNVLIPPVWSSARYLYEWRERDSFKIVTKDGLSGVIDRNNRLVVPCEYNGVSSTSNLEKIKGFIVSDPDDNRAMGLYVIGKGLVLPMRYSQVDYVETYDRKGYRVNLSMNNSYRVIKFLDYNTLQPTPDPGQDTMHAAGGYFLTGNPGYAFLLDKKGKWLLPSTYVDSITADTVYTVSYKQTGDSYLVTRKRLRTADLKPYSPAVIKIYYKTPPENYLDRGFRCGTSYANAGYIEQPPPMPNICIDGICGQRFFKDSLFFEAQWLASNGPNPNVGYYSYHALASTPARQDQPHSPPYYIVSGSQRAGSYLRYSAIVDSAINYVSPLLCETSIVSYNAKDKLLTINNRDGSALISTNNDILLPFQRKNLLGGFKWRGKVYAYCQAKKLQLISGEDSNIVRGWENVSLQQMPAFGYDIRDTNYEFVVQDSLRKVALIWPDGTKPYPALNFLYQDIKHISDGCFMVSPGDYKGLCKLVDAHNKELLPGVTIRNITAAKNLLSRSYSGAPYQSDDIVPDLYLVTTADYKYFFIDRYGRAYTNAKKITTPAKWP